MEGNCHFKTVLNVNLNGQFHVFVACISMYLFHFFFFFKFIFFVKL